MHRTRIRRIAVCLAVVFGQALVCRAGGALMQVLAVNDDYVNDRQGTNINPVSNAALRVALPA